MQKRDLVVFVMSFGATTFFTLLAVGVFGFISGNGAHFLICLLAAVPAFITMKPLAEIHSDLADEDLLVAISLLNGGVTLAGEDEDDDEDEDKDEEE